MSKKIKSQHTKTKNIRPDDYCSYGPLEMLRFGKNVILTNNSTPEQHSIKMAYWNDNYSQKYDTINQKISNLKDLVCQCNPYNLLMYLRSLLLLSHSNTLSEIDISHDGIIACHAQEYIQTILISSENCYNSTMSEDEESKLFDQIFTDFKSLYNDIQTFYYYWASHIQQESEINDQQIAEIVESQYMYLVRGKRYQFFELESLKLLLVPHDSILQELFGVSVNDIIIGMDRLRYSLSKGFSDAFSDLIKEFSVLNNYATPETIPTNIDSHLNYISNNFFKKIAINVKETTGWNNRFIDILTANLNNYPDIWETEKFPGWPIIDLPINKKPFIKIDGIEYAFLYYALFDNFYRNIQKSIISHKPTYLIEWKDKQAKTSERMVRDIFLQLFPEAEVYTENYYPVKNSLKQMNENDIILIYHNNLFIIEVKAGSFPTTPPIVDFDAHINAYRTLAEKADSQCSRTLNYILQHDTPQFYNKDKSPTFQIASNTFDDIFTFSVTIDNFTEFAAKAEKSSVISLKEDTIIISYDDLLLYNEYFDSPIYFLHYLKQRKAAMHVPQYQLQDEFDHLGLYIDQNLYTLNSTQYSEFNHVFFNGFRRDLDLYFNMLFVDPANAKKPQQSIPDELTEIINYLEYHMSKESISFAHFLLNMSAKDRESFADLIKTVLKRQKESSHTIPFMAVGDFKYCLFITCPGSTPYTFDRQQDYVYAAASRNVDMPIMWISLEYNSYDKLISAKGISCSFSDLPESETARIKNLGKIKAHDWITAYKRTNHKIGRNDPCPCGSGKKYKRCCLNVE